MVLTDLEIDTLIDNVLEAENRYILFPAGKVAYGFFQWAEGKIKIENIADNHKVGEFFNGREIQGTGILKNKNPLTKIIITTRRSNSEVEKQLMEMGFEKNKDFFDQKDFMSLWTMGMNKQLYIDAAQISVTTRCTLNCQACSMFMPYCKGGQDVPIELLKKDMNLFFSVVDHVKIFTIVGGEPFLYTQFADYITYVGEYHGDKIDEIHITTNGTVLLTENILALLQKYNVQVAISDYSKTLPMLEQAIKRTVAQFEKFSIQHSVMKNLIWKKVLGEEKKATPEFFNACGNRCRVILNGKYHCCTSAALADKSGLCEEDSSDAVELKVADGNIMDKKYEMLAQELGFIENGYLNFCKICNGNENNRRYIQAAEQIERNS